MYFKPIIIIFIFFVLSLNSATAIMNYFKEQKATKELNCYPVVQEYVCANEGDK